MKRLLLSLLTVCFMFCLVQPLFAADTVTCWFPPGWKIKAPQAQMITKTLSVESGLKIRPRIARNYPEIFTAFESNDMNIVYVGSFAQALIAARHLGTPLVQNVNGKEFYSGILITPKGVDPQMVLTQSPDKIAFAVGASSGESCAKAATQGKAAIGVANHGAAVSAVKAGRAKAAFVKNWWWEARAKDYPEMSSYQIPGISIVKNPDNVLTASKAVSPGMQQKIKAAAVASSSAFGKGANMQPFNASSLAFSLELMGKGKIDPLTYRW